MSLPAYAQLGVSGWVLEEIKSSDNPMPGLQYFPYIRFLSINPITRQPVICDEAHFADDRQGFAFCTRQGPSDWVIEQIPAYDDPAYREFCPSGILGSTSNIFVDWKSNGEPIAFVNLAIGLMDELQQPFVAQRIAGKWSVTRLTGKGDFSDGYIGKPVKTGVDRWVTLLKIEGGAEFLYRFIEWDNGSVRQFDPEFPVDDGEGHLYGSKWLFSDATGRILTYMTRHTLSSGQISEPIVRFWAGTPEEGWHWEVHDYSDLWLFAADDCYIEGIHLNPDGTPVVGAVRSKKSWYTGEGLYTLGHIQGQRRLIEIQSDHNWWLTPLRYSFSGNQDYLWSSGGYY